jgi:hypothetical protein
MKAMTRQELAELAGVSVRTLSNWCKPYSKELERMGMRRKMVLLPPNIVRWIIDKFCIDVDDE